LQEFVQAQVLHIAGLQTVQVAVSQRQPTLMLVYQREGRTANRFSDSHSSRNSTGQDAFPGSKWTAKKNGERGAKLLAEQDAKLVSLAL